MQIKQTQDESEFIENVFSANDICEEDGKQFIPRSMQHLTDALHKFSGMVYFKLKKQSSTSLELFRREDEAIHQYIHDTHEEISSRNLRLPRMTTHFMTREDGGHSSDLHHAMTSLSPFPAGLIRRPRSVSQRPEYTITGRTGRDMYPSDDQR